MNIKAFSTIQLQDQLDYLAPDGSEIRELVRSENGSLAHCVLPVGAISQAVKHKTIEEFWYVLEGNGELWRKNIEEDEVVRLIKGTGINIPHDTNFQFKNMGKRPLKILIVSIPKWPGNDEAIKVDNFWEIL